MTDSEWESDWHFMALALERLYSTENKDCVPAELQVSRIQNGKKNKNKLKYYFFYI